MDPNQMSFGSGSPLLGGTSPFQQVMQSQAQGDAGATAMQGANSAGFDPTTGQVAGAMPAGGAPPMGAPAPTDPNAQPQMPGMPQSPESQMILDVLSTRLKSLSKQEEAQVIPPKAPTMPQLQVPQY